MSGYSSRGQDVYLHCGVCGKRVYGRNSIDETLEAQKKHWEKDPDIQAAVRRQIANMSHWEKAQAEKQKQADIQRAYHRAERERQDQEKEDARLASHNKWMRKVAAERKVEAVLMGIDPKEIQKAEEAAQVLLGECAWMECTKARRLKSKYCSRHCSNKNSRFRFKLRKASDNPESVSA